MPLYHHCKHVKVYPVLYSLSSSINTIYNLAEKGEHWCSSMQFDISLIPPFHQDPRSPSSIPFLRAGIGTGRNWNSQSFFFPLLKNRSKNMERKNVEQEWQQNQQRAVLEQENQIKAYAFTVTIFSAVLTILCPCSNHVPTVLLGL